MNKLSTTTNLSDPDAVYAAIIEAHRGLGDAESAALNARLVLMLANHIGDDGVIYQALELARSEAR